MVSSAALFLVLLSVFAGLGAGERNGTSGCPLYMMQMYRAFQTSSLSHANASDSAANSDSVHSLTAKGCSQVGSRWSITFDLSSVPSGQRVLWAELRVRLPAFSASEASVDLYHSPCSPQSSRPCPHPRTLLGTLQTGPTTTTSSWKLFNVSGLIRQWRERGEGSAGWGEEGSGSGAGSGSGSWLQRPVSYVTTNRVTLVIFCRQELPSVGQPAYSLIQTVQKSKYTGRSHREQSGRRSKRNRLEHTVNERVRIVDRAVPTGAPEESRPLCRRVDMWVDFDVIGWDAWIIHPKRYNAFRCEGACPAPLDESVSPTNHAYMQSLVRHHQPERVSCPSCVPTRLSPLSMLYYDSDDLALRHHDDMVVEECGCH
ncbi:unnamed protein product [Knipowitschia caucasica]